MKNSDFILIGLCAIFIVMLTGCDTHEAAPKFIHSTSDMGRYDDAVADMCQVQAIKVTRELVMQAPEAFTEEGVASMMGFIYDNCIMNKSRGA